MIYFTADLHLNHSKINFYCNRPYKNSEIMDTIIINNYNSTISNKDTVYILGDLIFGGFNIYLKYISRLNGKKHLILGNHDNAKYYLNKLSHFFESISYYKEIKIDNQLIILCHYPLRTWNKIYYNSWMLYGHTHGRLSMNPEGKSLDVGIDCFNYFPVEFNELKQIISEVY